MKSKRCGNCNNWIKIKSIKGLCSKYDLGWTDSGLKACQGWERMHYVRVRRKTQREIIWDSEA